MSKKIGLNDFLQIVENKEPFVVNYGKGRLSDEFIKDYPVWDEKLNAYRDATGYWDMEILLEIAKGDIPEYSIELIENG